VVEFESGLDPVVEDWAPVEAAEIPADRFIWTGAWLSPSLTMVGGPIAAEVDSSGILKEMMTGPGDNFSSAVAGWASGIGRAEGGETFAVVLGWLP